MFVIILFLGNNQLIYCHEHLHRDPPNPDPHFNRNKEISQRVMAEYALI